MARSIGQFSSAIATSERESPFRQRTLFPLWSRAMFAKKPVWLLAAPAIFLILWSGGFSIAKLGIRHAEPLTFLALRYASSCSSSSPVSAFYAAAAGRARAADWFHVAMVGFLIQGVYFGLCYLAFKAGTPAGSVAIIVCLQPILVGLDRAAISRGERVSALRWVGLVLGLGGRRDRDPRAARRSRRNRSSACSAPSARFSASPAAPCGRSASASAIIRSCRTHPVCGGPRQRPCRWRSPPKRLTSTGPRRNSSPRSLISSSAIH